MSVTVSATSGSNALIEHLPLSAKMRSRFATDTTVQYESEVL